MRCKGGPGEERAAATLAAVMKPAESAIKKAASVYAIAGKVFELK
jgi:hypothetical protein